MADSYWEEREKRYREQLEKDEGKLKKSLGRYYDREARELETMIAGYYNQYGDGNVLEYRSMMDALSDEDRDLLMQNMNRFFAEHPDKAHLMPVRESIYKLNRLEGLQASVTLRQLEAGTITEKVVQAHLEKQAERGFDMSWQALGKGSEMNAMDKEAVKAIVSAPWSGGESFSDRIWKNTLKVSEYVNTDIAQGLARGDNYDKLVKSTMDRFRRVSKSDAMRLVYTEGTHVAAESQALALESVFDTYKVSPAPGACPICVGVAQNGPFRFKNRTAGVNCPPLHPWCRCTIEVADDLDRWLDSKIEAEKLIDKAKDVEPSVTRDISKAVRAGSGHLEGLDYRIKGLDSLARNLQTESAKRDMPVSSCSDKMTDVLRYTQVSEPGALVDDYQLTVDKMRVLGYNQKRVVNTFVDDGATYKGINTLMRTPDGYVFEIQYHTPESLAGKELNHKFYEETRLPSTPQEIKMELFGKMKRNSAVICVPHGAERIKGLK